MANTKPAGFTPVTAPQVTTTRVESPQGHRPPDDPRPTVLQLLHGLPIGGAEMLAFRLATELSHAFRFVFGCLDQVGELGEQLRDQGFPVHHLERRPGVDPRCTLRLVRLLRREQVDVVHAHQYTPFFYALAARGVGGRQPVLFTEHGRWHPDYPRRKRILFNRLMLRRRDRVIGVGRDVARALVENEGIPEDRVEVVYNGIDTRRFDSSNSQGLRETVRKELGLPTDRFLIVQVARLDHLKDHCTAVRAIERLHRGCRDAHLLVVGEGDERATIEDEIENRDLTDVVTLAGLRKDIPRILCAADVYLLTSISEGIPLTVIEAMAAGLPVVSTDVGGVSEVVLDGQTGYLAPAGDDEALAAALHQVSRDADSASRMGQHGKQRAKELFSESENHEMYREILETMCR